MHIHILGKGEGWEEIKDVKEGEIIYGVNDSFLRVPKVTHTFHMHDMDEYYENERTHSSTKLCAIHGKEKPEMEFYSLYEWKMVPHSKAYPLDEIVNHFGVCYFNSTLDYMLAFAIYSGATEISLYGVNMTQKEEWRSQKPGVEFWIGVAMGKGIKVNIQHDYTSLFKSKVWDGEKYRFEEIYGYYIPQFKPETTSKT